jgi:YspA, cpYpsA-related SLOG family
MGPEQAVLAQFQLTISHKLQGRGERRGQGGTPFRRALLSFHVRQKLLQHGPIRRRAKQRAQPDRTFLDAVKSLGCHDVILGIAVAALHRRSDTEVMLPAGPKVAFTSGPDFNDHAVIWDQLDKVRAKHPDMVLLQADRPRGPS